MTTAATHFVLIDANSLGMTAAARNHHARHAGKRPEWRTREGFPNGAIHGMVDALLYALRAVEGAHPGTVMLPILLWDGRAQWRYDLHPGYKERSTDPDYVEMKALYKMQVPVLRGLWHRVGMPQVIGVDEEADDIAGHLAPRLARHGPVTAISKDSDWLQIVADNVRLYVHGEYARWISHHDLATAGKGGKFGYASTRAFVQCKALAGDDSDTIPGVELVGLQTAAKLVAEFGSVEAYWAAVDAGTVQPKGVIRERLASAQTRALFARNLRLMDWACSPPMQPSTYLWTGPHDRAEALAILHELQLRMVANRLAEYTPTADHHAALANPNHPLHRAMAEAQWPEAEAA